MSKDKDLQLNKAGWQVYYLPQATTIHFGGRSMNRWPRRKMVYRGKMLFYQKNYDPVRAYALRIMLGVLSLAKIMVWGIAAIIPGKREQARRELESNLDVIQLCWKLA